MPSYAGSPAKNLNKYLTELVIIGTLIDVFTFDGLPFGIIKAGSFGSLTKPPVPIPPPKSIIGTVDHPFIVYRIFHLN